MNVTVKIDDFRVKKLLSVIPAMDAFLFIREHMNDRNDPYIPGQIQSFVNEDPEKYLHYKDSKFGENLNSASTKALYELQQLHQNKGIHRLMCLNYKEALSMDRHYHIKLSP